MDKNIAELIVNCGEGDLSLREGYSGRGMFGKETTGIITESYSHFVKACVAAAIEDPERMEMFFDEPVCSDNMGLDIIFY